MLGMLGIPEGGGGGMPAGGGGGGGAPEEGGGGGDERGWVGPRVVGIGEKSSMLGSAAPWFRSTEGAMESTSGSASPFVSASTPLFAPNVTSCATMPPPLPAPKSRVCLNCSVGTAPICGM